MAGESVEIRIIAHDGTSQVFRAIQQNADRLGRDLTDAGKDGDKAFDQIERGAKDADRAIDRAAQSARTFGDRMEGAARGIDEFGEGLLVVGAGLTYAGNKAMEQERQIIALRSAYGDAADEIIQFAEELDNVTIFDDEDIRAGQRFFASLYNNYDLSIQQIEDLMRTTADLASASGLSFEDASNRVTAAIRGEGEAAEWLGLTMNQQSIDRENLTLTMTNQEAAQFRLNALYQQAAVYEGTAAEIANSSIGTYADLKDTVNDYAGALGGAIGPMGAMMTGIGTMSIGLAGTVGVFGKVAAAARTSTLAMSALSLATNPLVLGIGALTIAGVAWYKSLDEGESVLDRFETTMDALFLENDGQNFFENFADGVKTFVTGADDAVLKIEEIQASLDSLQQTAIANNSTELAVAESTMRSVDAMNDRYLAGQQMIGGLTLEEEAQRRAADSGEDYQTVLKQLKEEYETDQSEITAYLDAQQKIGQAFLDGRHDTAAMQAELDKLHNAYGEGLLTYDNYRGAIQDMSNNLDDYITVSDETTASNERQAESFNLITFALDRASEARAEYLRVQEEMEEHQRAEAEHADTAWERMQQRDQERRAAAEAEHEAERQRQEEERQREEEHQQARLQHEDEAAQIQQQRYDEERARREQQRQEDEAAYEAKLQRARDFIAQSRELGGLDDPLSTINLTSLSTESSRFAEDIGIANAALENTFRIVVGNTNAMAQTAQATEDWITELVGAQGEWGTIDDLLANGTISAGEYNAAIQAQTDILAANAIVQNEILGIQARQAPLIADLTQQQAEYLRGLGDMSSEQQLVALGWMDSATAAQAYEATTLAASAANGEFGASGRMMVEQMIQGAVAANPVLGEMLEQMGLISVGADGTITVHFDSVEGAQSEIARLTESIDALIITLGGVPPVHVDADTQGAVDAIADVENRLLALGGQETRVTVNADAQPAADVLSGALDALRGLDGEEATVHAEGDNAGAVSAVLGAHAALDGLSGRSVMTYELGDNAGALGAVAGAHAALNGIDGRTATSYITAVSSVGGAVASAINALNSIDGRTATTYVNTVYSSIGGAAAGALATGGTVWGDDPLPAGRYGLVPRAANGRTVLVGEVGPELVTLPHGAQVTPHVASMSRLDAPPDALPMPPINLHVYGNVYGIDDLADALTGAMDRRRRGYGMVTA